MLKPLEEILSDRDRKVINHSQPSWGIHSLLMRSEDAVARWWWMIS